MHRNLVAIGAAAALAITGCSSAPKAPEDVDQAICDSLVYTIKTMPEGTGGVEERLDPHKLLAWIHKDLDDAGDVAPTQPFADAIGMIERTADKPSSSWIIGVDTLSARCMDAGYAPSS